MTQDEIVAELKKRGDRQVHIAGLLQISAEKVSRAFAGKRKFTPDEMVILLTYLGRLPERPVARLKSPSQTYRSPRNANGVRLLPVVGLVPAGNWREAVEITKDYMVSPDPDLSEEAFVVEVDGDSMDRIAPAGTRVVIEPGDRRLIVGKVYVVRNSEGDVTLKQYMSDPARLVPCSTNDEHREIVLGEDNPGEIIGRAVWRSTRM